MMKTVRLLGVVLGVFLVWLPLFSQGETGRISGTVTDQTGGAIVGATVTIVDVARGQNRPLMADAAGQYAAPNLIPGAYTVRVEATGFKVLERANIQVGVGADIRIDLTLQPGEQTQTVTVTGEVPAMNTTNAQTGGTIENNLLESLPINGGSYRALTSILPGVTKLPGSGVDDQSTNGGGTEWDNYMLDGLYDVSVWVNTATVGSTTSSGDTTLLPLDAIQEVNLISNPKAEYGYYPGTTVDVGLKSGTNALHGSAWAFGRDTSFDARNPFSATRAPVEFEQFGAVFGGPIKKNKLFYFVAYEGSRANIGSVAQTTSPTTAAFTTPSPKISFPDAIADMINKGHAPNTLSLNIAGCDATKIAALTGPGLTGTTVAADCKANQLGSPGLWNNTGLDPIGQITETLPNFGGSDNGLFKLDYKVNEHHSFNAEYYMGNSVQQVPPANGNSALAALSTQPWWETVFGVYTRTGRVVEIWTPNSNWLNEIRGGYDFQDQPNYNAECGTTSSIGHAGGPASYLTTYNLVSGADVVNGQQGCGFPTMIINGFQAKLDNTSLRLGGGRDLQFSDNVSYSRGSHQFKWGFNLRKQCLCLSSKLGTAGIGTVTFGQTGFAAFSDVIGGQTVLATPLESFLAGTASSTQILAATGSIRNIHYNLLGLFLQDDWRVGRKLTLNLGVRWEGETPGRDSGGQLGNFDPAVPSGMVQSNQLWPFQSSPSPHVGLAYDISGKGTTVIRAGGSIAYVYQSMIQWTSLANDSPQAQPTGAKLINKDGTNTVASPGNILAFQSTFIPPVTAGVITAAPWAAGAPIFNASSFVTACGNGLQIPGSSPAKFNPPSCTLYGAPPNIKVPYMSTWNLSVQHAFTSALTLNVAYVGTHGTDLNFQGDINQPTPGDPGKPEQLRRPFYNAFPWFGKAVFNFVGGSSDYNGLQVTLAERVSHGLGFTAGYTWSHALGTGSGANASVANINDLRAEYGNMPIDFRQRFTLTTTYNVPGIKAPLQMLQGWSLASNLQIMSSPAMTASDASFDTSGTGTGLDRWNLVGNASDFSALIGGVGFVPCYGVSGGSNFKAPCTLVTSSGSTDISQFPQACQQGANSEPSGVGANTGVAALLKFGCYVAGPGNRSAIIPPAQGTWGTMGTGVLRNAASGGFQNWDLSLQKNWKIKERFTAQFRAEAFNVINRTNYFLPSTALGSPGTFGRAQSTPDVGKGVPITGLGGAREMQLGLKFIF